MDLSLSHCFITISDPDQALVFYRDVLGLDLRGDVSNGGYRWLTFVTDSQPGLEIVLSEAHGGRSQADGDALLALLAKGALNAALFRTGDLEGTFEKIRASGADVVQEPTDQPWGVRDCAVRDPAGNLIRISQA